jgi:hypothetical protein
MLLCRHVIGWWSLRIGPEDGSEVFPCCCCYFSLDNCPKFKMARILSEMSNWQMAVVRFVLCWAARRQARVLHCNPPWEQFSCLLFDRSGTDRQTDTSVWFVEQKKLVVVVWLWTVTELTLDIAQVREIGMVKREGVLGWNGMYLL